MSKPLEHDYIGLKDLSLMSSKPPEKPTPPSSSSSSASSSSTLKETELRLGLPGSLSPERKPNTPQLSNNKNDMLGFISLSPVSGAKRVFSDAINGVPGKWVFSNNKSDMELGIKGGTKLFHGENKNETNGKPVLKEVLHASSCQSPKAVQEKNKQVGGVNEHGAAPAPKAQVVGWPPIRSFRKNSMASNLAKNSEDGDGKPGFGCLYVKVSMDGAPYLRKVDLKTYSNYNELSAGLEKMFSCFTIVSGQCASNGLPRQDNMNESHLIDLVHGSEYVLTYEDKDGDWMLVGDVPWEMFTDTCRRLRIMKGSEAIGLAPRSAEKCKNQD